jgi:succinoglycan biosynthesis protein ExoA
MPYASIVVPVLNEARFIAQCLTSLLAQAPDDAFEILVMDGGSIDGTQAIVHGLQLKHRCIQLIHDSGSTPAAMNLASRIASPRATILVRADAHALYPPDFLQKCLRALAETGATSVVVPLRAIGASLGNGGSPHHTRGPSRFVDEAHHAAFSREFFVSLGGYNENCSNNEDSEYDTRAARAGGRAWFCNEAAVTYFPRRSLRSLGRQYFCYGHGRAHTLFTLRTRPRLRQLAPVAIMAGCVGGLGLMLVHPSFGLVPLAYVTTCTIWGTWAAFRAREPWLIGMGVAAMIMHFAWALGFLSFAFGFRGIRVLRAAGRF